MHFDKLSISLKKEVGDEVILITKRHGTGKHNPYTQDYPGITGIVQSMMPEDLVSVRWSCRTTNTYMHDDLAIINRPPRENEKGIRELREEKFEF